jgi:hypothetical protein
MDIEFYIISGFSLAVEYVSPASSEDGEHCVVIDLGILRTMFFWGNLKD